MGVVKIVILSIAGAYMIIWPIVARRLNLGLPVAVFGGLMGLAAMLGVVLSN